MIAYLRGRIQEASIEAVVLDVEGVGYELFCPLGVVADLQTQRGKTAEFYISTQVREDAINLYGFATRKQKQMFVTLLKVNGVGPKMALNILSGTSESELIRLIESEDVKGLSKLPKVGKKTAEQIILTLKGKLVSADSEELLPAPSGTPAEIMSALVNLGFRPADVDKVVSLLDKSSSFEDGVRVGLAKLTSLTGI